MSTTHRHLERLSYERIDAQVRALDLSAFAERQSVIAAGGEDLLPRLQSVYRAVRPILSIVAELPLLPSHWRDALRLFVATLDAIAAAGDVPVEEPAPAHPRPDFKAGKDLSS